MRSKIMEHLMTTTQMHIPVADPTDRLGAMSTHGVAFSSTGNSYEIATVAAQVAHHDETQLQMLSPHFWMVPTIVDC